MSAITNIAAYRFAPLTDLKPLRERLLGLCRGWNLKGTILLSPEGINLFVAGPRPEIDLLVDELRHIPGLEELTPKYSDSAEQPFKRMLVRLKKEIIAFGVEGIRPGERTSPKLSAQTLKQWLDEGRKVTLLDTRNDYEVKLGTFKGALTLGLDHFRNFPQAVEALPEEMKDEPIVMFCTGGIRCEKAGPFMEREGFRKVFQLDGGILKYFEECGAEHYEGECFVFDQRVGVDPALRETESGQCFACQTPLTAEEQTDSRFVVGVSCPHCFRSEEELVAERLAARQAAWNLAVSPLPGSLPGFNRKPFDVPEDLGEISLFECLCTLFPETLPEEWQARIAQGRFLDDQSNTLKRTDRLAAGQRYVQLIPMPFEPDVETDLAFLYEDEAVLVVRKPAGLPTLAQGEFRRNNLQHLLQIAYAPEKPRPVHELQPKTAGLILVARTRHFAKMIQKQPIISTQQELRFTHPVTGREMSFPA